MATCGTVNGGQPCEFFGVMTRCPAVRMLGDEHLPACAPMLSLVEARADAARWKRAAEWIARHHGETCPEGCVCPDDDQRGCEVGLLTLALKEVPR